ncbi:unnamed protein product [Chrysoparadoxa australica]
MGGGVSKKELAQYRQFIKTAVPRGKGKKQQLADPVAKAFRDAMITIHMPEKEAAMLFAVFLKCDMDQSAAIKWGEFTRGLGLSNNPFLKRVFEHMDSGHLALAAAGIGNSSLDAAEFVLGLYSWCTLPTLDIASRVFDLYTADLKVEGAEGQPTLDKQAIATMMREIHGIGYGTASDDLAKKQEAVEVKDLVSSITERLPEGASLKAIERKYFLSALSGQGGMRPLKPVLKYQKQFREATMGEVWWKEQSERLVEVMKLRSVFTLEELIKAGPHQNFGGPSDEFLARERPEIAEPAGEEDDHGINDAGASLVSHALAASGMAIQPTKQQANGDQGGGGRGKAKDEKDRKDGARNKITGLLRYHQELLGFTPL